jgi:hypothetical protein
MKKVVSLVSLFHFSTGRETTIILVLRITYTIAY